MHPGLPLGLSLYLAATATAAAAGEGDSVLTSSQLEQLVICILQAVTWLGGVEDKVGKHTFFQINYNRVSVATESS